MYIIELICKIKEKIQNKEFSIQKKKNSKEEALENNGCEHIFVPVDSTKTVLACTKCGFLIKVKNQKETKKVKNPFK